MLEPEIKPPTRLTTIAQVGLPETSSKWEGASPLLLQPNSLPTSTQPWQSLMGNQLAKKERSLQSPRGIKQRTEG